MQATACAAKASFNSTRSRSSMVQLFLSKILFVATTGPYPMISGSRAAAVTSTIFAIGFTPVSFTFFPLIKTRQEAPSFKPQAFPAVTVPSGFTIGLSFARISMVVVGFTNSSVSKINVFFLSFTSIGTISSLKYPISMAFAARCWLSMEKASCSSRVMWKRSATFSAVLDMLSSLPYTEYG